MNTILKSSTVNRGLGFILAIFFAITYIFPFLLIVINPFKERVEIIENPLSLPIEFNFDNFRSAYEQMDYPAAFANSFFITAGALILLVIFPSMLAFYLARFNNRLNNMIFFMLVISMIIPFQALMIPFVSIYGKLGMLNDRVYLLYYYLGFGTSLATFVYHGFIKAIPMTLDESATIEGANKFQVFWYVIFPIMRPTTATILILNALWVWNDYLLPSLVLILEDRTLPLSTFTFFGQYTSDYGLAMAGLVLSIIPIIIFYLILQRNIISGITDGALK